MLSAAGQTPKGAPADPGEGGRRGRHDHGGGAGDRAAGNRGQPGNIFGQICPVFMALWVPVGAMGMALYGWTEGMLDRVKRTRQ